jgi:hypothetical protein
MHYKDRLFAIAIWSKIMCLILLSKVRITTSKKLRRCSRGGVPRLVPHSKKEVAKTTQARNNGAAD